MNVKRILTNAVMSVSTRRGLTTALVQVDMNFLVTTKLALVRYFPHTHTHTRTHARTHAHTHTHTHTHTT